MKTLLFITLILISNFLMSQKPDPIWLALELKGGLNTPLLINPNYFNDGNIDNDLMQTTPQFGAAIQIHFNKKVAIHFEYSFNDIKKKFIYFNNLSDPQFMTIDQNSVLFQIRATGQRSGFGGIGIQYTTINSVIENGNDVSHFYTKTYLAPVVEIAGGIYHNNLFDISMSIRASYAIKDVIKDDIYLMCSYTNQSYTSRSSTNPLNIQYFLNINWHIGYFRTSGCKQKSAFVLFTN